MKKIIPVIITLTLSFNVSRLAAAEETADARIRSVEQRLRPVVRIGGRPVWTLEERMKQFNVPGVGIAVFKNYELDWAKCYGLRNAPGGEPVTKSTLFQIASISKPFTAAVALKLVEDGLLELDRNVNDYLRAWKVPENEFTRVEKVTLRRLLSHNAGLTVSGFRGYAEGEKTPTILQVLDGLAPANNDPIRVDRRPGSGYRYSGGGYTVAQLLIEEVSGRPLARLMQELIFDPLGMKDTLLDPEAQPASSNRQMAMAHLRDGTAKRGHRFLVGGSGCCEIWTTPRDLALFALALQRALRGDKDSILSQETARWMTSPSTSPEMGLGFQLIGDGQAVYFTHSGGNVGFSSALIASRDSGDGVAVTTNGNSSIPNEIFLAVAETYGWRGIRANDFESLEALTGYIRRLRTEDPGNAHVSENEVNQLGYLLMRSSLLPEAVEVFRLNAEFHPLSANAQDSLAEALTAAGDILSALAGYRLALANLDRYPKENAAFERNRKAVESKVAELEKRLKEKKKP